jgi:phage shock protein A
MKDYTKKREYRERIAVLSVQLERVVMERDSLRLKYNDLQTRLGETRPRDALVLRQAYQEAQREVQRMLQEARSTARSTEDAHMRELQT